MLSILLDIEWLLSTLFDASLLTFEPPETAAPFFASRAVPFRGRRSWCVGARSGARPQTLSGQDPSLLGICSLILSRTVAKSHNALILLTDLAATAPPAGPAGSADVAAQQLCPNLRCGGAGHRGSSRAMLRSAARGRPHNQEHCRSRALYQEHCRSRALSVALSVRR